MYLHRERARKLPLRSRSISMLYGLLIGDAVDSDSLQTKQNSSFGDDKLTSSLPEGCKARITVFGLDYAVHAVH